MIKHYEEQIGQTRRDFLKQGLAGLAALVAGYLPLQAEECSKPAEIKTEIKKQETEKTPEKKIEEKVKEFGIYDAGLYTPREKEPYRALEREMFDKNKKVKGDLEKILGPLDFKITPRVKEITGIEYFGRCTESELFDSWKINGEEYLVGRYDLWRHDENGKQVGDQNLVVISKKGIFPLLPAKLPAKIPSGGIVYTAVAGDNGTILVAELGNQPEKMMGNTVAVFIPNKDGGYSPMPNACIRLPEMYKPDKAIRAYDNQGESYDGIGYKHISGEYRVLGTYQNPNENMAFPIYRFSNPETKGEYKNDK